MPSAESKYLGSKLCSTRPGSCGGNKDITNSQGGRYLFSCGGRAVLEGLVHKQRIVYDELS